MTSRKNNPNQYDIRLFHGLEEKDKKEAHKFLSTNFVIERLREVLRAERDSLQVNRKDYDNPNWAHKQAHFNGEYLALSRILKMLGESEDNQS